MEYSPRYMKKVLEENGLNFKKMFGQNFIIDGNIIDSIVNKANIDRDTLVIEIGPGAGSLTYKLSLSAGRVLCYEIDHTLENILKENLKECNNVDIIYSDFLKCNVKEDIEKYQFKKIYVVSNLPYYITTPIIVKIIEDDLQVDKIVVMVQKEVGDRFKATPGTRDYSSLSVFLNYYYIVKKVADVSRNVFMPAPNVDSIVLEFDKKNDLLYLKNKNLFFKLVRDSFRQKRKNLRNNLRGYDLDTIENVLKNHNYDLSIRAEQISLDLFVEIANSLE